MGRGYLSFIYLILFGIYFGNSLTQDSLCLKISFHLLVDFVQFYLGTKMYKRGVILHTWKTRRVMEQLTIDVNLVNKGQAE